MNLGKTHFWLSVNTLLKEEFPSFVKSQIQKREKTVLLRKRLELDVIADVAHIFKSSNMVSSKSFWNNS